MLLESDYLVVIQAIPTRFALFSYFGKLIMSVRTCYLI